MNLSQTATLQTEKSGHGREVAIVESLKQDSVYGLSAKINGSCKEVETRFSVRTVRQEKKKAGVEKWPLVGVMYVAVVER